eukprot:5020094-Lingulodinium_polyedra.AAC.1
MEGGAATNAAALKGTPCPPIRCVCAGARGCRCIRWPGPSKHGASGRMPANDRAGVAGRWSM